MGRKLVYYIDENLEIKKGYTGNIKINKVNEVVIEYKNNKLKINSELVAETKDKLNKQLDKMKVVKIAESYGLKARWINDSLEITSTFDLWYIHEQEYKPKYKKNTQEDDLSLEEENTEELEAVKKLVWIHKNKEYKSHSNHEHIQKIMYSNQIEDYCFIFRSIAQHDNYRLVRKTKNHMMHLYDMIKTNNIPKLKLS